MFRSISLVFFIGLSLMKGISAKWCYYGFNAYYCSSGQTCGSHYGDCRGLPTYAIIAIVSTSILVLSICVRCCAQLHSSTTRSIPSSVPTSIENPQHVKVQVYSVENNVAT